MCPQLPRLSPEYSHKVGLQTVITGMPLQIRPVTHGGHAGPVTMGRNARGPLSWTRPHCGMPFVASLRLVRYTRRVSLPILSLLAQLLQRRLRAKGGALPSPQHLPSEGPVRQSHLVPKTSLDGGDAALARSGSAGVFDMTVD
jgi:hypothetical protein